MSGLPSQRVSLRVGALAVACLLSVFCSVMLFATVTAYAASSPASLIGYDVSYPQCEVPPPAFASFAVVGVNGGLANDASPCLSMQLSWAAAAPGLPHQKISGLQLYLDAADPGDGVADWPSVSAGTAGADTPYGRCDGSWSRACAYEYGVQRASYSYALVGPAVSPSVAPAPGLPGSTDTVSAATASTAPWWIDVEITASWARRTDARDWALVNIAAVRGFAAGLRSAGARGAIGLYSNAYQWRAITGLTLRTSPRYFPADERDWVTGSSSLEQARRACSRPFAGRTVALTQFLEAPYDRDYACPRPRRRSLGH
jgi:hypothetical protein